MQTLSVISANIWSILISLVNLALLTWVIKRFLYKPVMKVVEGRRAAIDGDYARAKEAREQAEQDQQRYAAAMAGARQTADQLIAKGAVQTLSFGPALVENGNVSVDADDEVGRAKASNPRTAIGIKSDGTYIFVVSDGRTEESEGLSLLQLAEFMGSLGAETAYNLDGGGSSTMVFNGTIINNPTTGGRSIKERSVSDIVYVG